MVLRILSILQGIYDCKNLKCPCGKYVSNQQKPDMLVYQLLEVLDLPWYCCHYPNGCREILECDEWDPNEDGESKLEQHQDCCLFRPVNCLTAHLTSCKKIPFIEVMDHFNQ